MARPAHGRRGAHAANSALRGAIAAACALCGRPAAASSEGGVEVAGDIRRCRGKLHTSAVCVC